MFIVYLFILVMLLIMIAFCFGLIVAGLSCLCFGLKPTENFKNNLKENFLKNTKNNKMQGIFFNYMYFCLNKSLEIYKKEVNMATVINNIDPKKAMYKMIISVFAVVVFFISILLF